MKILRTSMMVAATALSLAVFSNPAFARQHTMAVKKTAVKTAVGRKKTKLRARAEVPVRPSFGQIAGLHGGSDELSLKSSVAYVIDQDTQEVLLSKNDNAILPIASITKLMTGLVVRESNLSLDEPITITNEDVDMEKGSSSRLRPGTTLTRGELLHLALMSSENRAAHALGRTYPQGLSAFIQQMNAKAKQLGMSLHAFMVSTLADAFIAALALANGFIVATCNTRPLEAAGVTVINPWEGWAEEGAK